MSNLVISLVPYDLQGVEPERCPSFSNALKHNKPIYTNTTASIADGLLVPTVGVNAFATGGKKILNFDPNNYLLNLYLKIRQSSI